jgi:hypothetical protein
MGLCWAGQYEQKLNSFETCGVNPPATNIIEIHSICGYQAFRWMVRQM